MRDYERIKLQEVVRNITNDTSNKQLVDRFNYIIDDVVINEPSVWISAKDFRTLVKLAHVPQELYKKTADLPHIALQKESEKQQ